MSEREMVELFMGMLQGVYYDRMVGSTSVGFSELVMIGEIIEIGLKLGKLQMDNVENAPGGAGKKPFSGYHKKKEEANAVYGHRNGRGRCRQHDQPQLKLVTLKEMPPLINKVPANFNANALCGYHSGGVGHDVKNCWALKYKVQELLDSKVVQFTPVNAPNVIQNLMLVHVVAVNMVEVVYTDEHLNLITEVGELSTPLLAIKEYSVEYGVPIKELEKEKVEKVEEEIVVISIPYTPKRILAPARPVPLVVTMPGPVLYSSEKAVPWHYGSDVYYHGIKQVFIPVLAKKEEVEKEDVNAGDFSGAGRITRSGRVFAPPNSQDVADALEKAKEKQVDDGPRPVQVNLRKDDAGPSQTQEVEKLLKIIRKSNYKLNGLGFTDSDLPVEGQSHNKALHISIECKGTTLSRVLVDIGSSLNVLPKSAMMKIDYSGVKIRPSDMHVRAFDGSQRSFFGEVDLLIKVGPQIFTDAFFVMDIHPAYCCLLGRPWIHGAGVVTSTLHQKMKYPIDGKIAIVCGEEEYIVSHLSSFRYVEVEGEIHETPFQAFEAGHTEGWRRVLDLPPKFDKFSLGFRPVIKSNTHKPSSSFTPVKFASGGIVRDGQVNVATDEVDNDYEMDQWIKPSVPGQELNN
ncbi:uncharacterized protein LOC127081614 [Lathyrus oleraceus]|uniref:uncharacterized protein LOC127081614 n=1 Tax=Pisum sativum TaxID=3888 RepID=UPI0021D211CA|nr:uncharacterized protein LOC127081614 [Pisum sativum]